MRKKIFTKILLLFFVIVGGRDSYSQSNPILDNFLIFENNGRVYLSWQIVAGSTCNGIQIFRSTDNLNFTRIGEIVGVCGSISSAVSYSYSDDTPVSNKVNSYRLEFGGNGYSEILSVEIIGIENGYHIRPNPVVSSSTLFFDNDSRHEHQLFIYDLTGRTAFTFSTRENFFNISEGDFSSGTYVFRILSKEGLTASGKINIQ